MHKNITNKSKSNSKIMNKLVSKEFIDNTTALIELKDKKK